MALMVDVDSLKKSHRCSSNICKFVKENLMIDIESHRNDETNIIYIEDKEEAKKIITDDNIIKLFYQKSNSYDCYSINWGKSKGQDHYQDVCIVLNATTLKNYKLNNLSELVPSTKNKLYVACTRCRGNLYFIDEKSI
jgi:hypothetical protein